MGLAASGSDMMPVLIFGGFGLLVVIGIIWGTIASRKRRQALEAWAKERGLAYLPGSNGTIERFYPAFECLRQGRNRYAENILWGPCGAHWFVGFDYRYVTGTGKHQQTHHFSMVILRVDVELKPLLARPEGLWDKVKTLFGSGDISFENAEFNKRYHVTAADEEWAREVFGPDVMQHLLSTKRRYSVQLEGPLVAVWGASTFGPAEFQDATAVACMVMEHLPERAVQGLVRGRGQQSGDNPFDRPLGDGDKRTED